MTRPEGTQHTCPAGYDLVAKSIDPATVPVLEDGQVLLIKAGPNHYLHVNTSGKDVSHYDVCESTAPPVTAPPVTAPPVTAPPVTVPEAPTDSVPPTQDTVPEVPEEAPPVVVTLPEPVACADGTSWSYNGVPCEYVEVSTSEPREELAMTGFGADLAVAGGLVLLAGVVLVAVSRLITRRNYSENEVGI